MSTGARHDLVAVWTSAAWRAEAEAWIRDRLAAAGIAVTGPIEQPRVRPWSTQLVVPTDRGRYWFKENNPAMAFEAALVARLSELAPGRVLAPVAVAADRGWLLGPDGGRTVRESGGPDEAGFTRILTEYAELQRHLAGHGAELVGTGLPALEPARSAEHLAGQVADLAALPDGHPLRAGSELRARSVAYRPVLVAAAERLAETPIPLSLQHNDLHQNNAFAAEPGRPLRFFDFGDAVWGHPFCVLHVTLVVLAQEWSCGPWSAAGADPRLDRLVDAYLECWSDLAPRAELRRLVEPAMVIGRLHRYNSWHRLLPYLPMDMLTSHVGYLSSLLCGSAVGAR
ncbi:phosphotransferase [Microlunatus sp. GCM10028923]|uniref:phosphotransferase n=1 Tax=Microlunatus sp. GCM10028923 TaxID=3273400 RepID=UPI003620B98B